MTIHAIRLKNFMAFEDTDWVELRPISLIFGRNSSGKSTLIRALRLLKQSAAYGSPEEPLVLTVEDQIGLEDFATIYNRRPDDLQERTTSRFPPLDGIISFGFRCDLPSTMDRLQAVIQETECSLGLDDRIFEQAQIDFYLGFSWNPQIQQIQLSQIQLNLPSSASDNKHVLQAKRLYEIEADEYSQQILWEDKWSLESDFFHDFPEDVGDPELYLADVKIELVSPGFLPWLNLDDELNDPNLFLLQDILAELGTGVDQFLKSLSHLGPIRPAPERFYMFDKVKMQRWERQSWRHYLEFLGEDIDRDKLPELNHWLQQLDLGSTISVKQENMGKNNVFISVVRVVENGSTPTGPELNGHTLREENVPYTVEVDEEHDADFGFHLIDMGYGTSQILPILVRCVLADAGEFIIIEQPELHLHPRAQAQIGDLLVQTARRGVHLLIETHSEHLLLRLRRWAAETSIQDNEEVLEKLGQRRLPIDASQYLQAEELQAYYVYRDGVSRVATLPIDEQGEMDISDAPEDFDDFFSDDLMEISALTRASLG